MANPDIPRAPSTRRLIRRMMRLLDRQLEALEAQSSARAENLSAPLPDEGECAGRRTRGAVANERSVRRHRVDGGSPPSR